MVELKITVTDEGGLTVSGPINNKGLCYQLLELAKDEIRNHIAKQQSSAIIPATAILPFPGKPQ